MMTLEELKDKLMELRFAQRESSHSSMIELCRPIPTPDNLKQALPYQHVAIIHLDENGDFDRCKLTAPGRELCGVWKTPDEAIAEITEAIEKSDALVKRT